MNSRPNGASSGTMLRSTSPRACGAISKSAFLSKSRRRHLRRARCELEWFVDACADALSEPSNPLVDGLLDEGAMSVFYGESNSGKTFVALDMALAVASGTQWNGKETKRGLVVYVAAEGGKRIMRRLAALKKRYHAEHGEDAPPPLLALVRFPIDLRSNDANLKELLALIRAAEAETGEKCVWIIVDTLSRALAGGDENSPIDMGRIVVAADRIRAETGAHFSYVHHCGKDAARGARGHSLLRAATDTEIEVTVGALKVTKQRDMEGGEAYGFTLTDIYIGDDPAGQPVRSAVVDWLDAPKAESATKIKAVPGVSAALDGQHRSVNRRSRRDVPAIRRRAFCQSRRRPDCAGTLLRRYRRAGQA